MSNGKIIAQMKDFIEHPCDSMNSCQPCVNCKDDKRQIIAMMEEGHTYHCACRSVWGDGECECRLQGIQPPPVSQAILAVQQGPL